MSGKNPRVNPLLARKQLLVATSELNRAALLNDLTTLHHEVTALTERAKSFGTLTSAATLLLTGLAQGSAAPSAKKTSWFPTIFKGAELVTNLWLVFRPKRKVSSENS